MEGKLIVLGVAVLILVLVMYLFYDSGFIRKVVSKTRKAIPGAKPVKLINSPIILLKEGGARNYQRIEVNKKVFTIGRSAKNDLVIDSEAVEDRHAVLYKRIKNERIYYELVNYGKVNPVEYYNNSRDHYEWLGYKDGEVLDSRETFYIGDAKLVITIPVMTHEPTKTERLGSEKQKESAEHKNTDRKVSQRIFRKEEIDI